MTLNKKKLSIWLIGPSAAGKTTVSKLLNEEIKNKINLVIIDGDQVRNLYENNLEYDKISRSKNTRRYINLVKWLNHFKISSIVAVISPFEKDREICRKEIKNYFEIYLKSSREERIRRDKKKLYAPAIKGEKKML
jgi:adenylylsulfate kinase